MRRSGWLWRTKVPLAPSRLPFHYGWLIAAVGCVGMVASVPGQTIGVNVFSEQLIRVLELSRAQVSGAYFVGTAMSGFVLPWAGSWFDRFGARRLIVLAAFGLAGSLLYLSGVDRIAAAVSGVLGDERLVLPKVVALLVGFFFVRFWGQGVVMMCSRNMIGKWWVAHRGKVFSFGGMAVALCFSLAPKFFDSLIEAYGWRGAWWLLALLIVPCFVVLAWALYRDNPDECGLKPDAGLPAPKGQDNNPEFRVVKEYTRGEALRSYPFWCFSMVFALQACYITAYSFHVIDIGVDIGMDKGAILALFVPSAVVSSAVSLFVGWACDRWRLKYLLAFMAFGIALAPLGLISGDLSTMSSLVVIGFGIGSGCLGTLSGAFMPRFYGLKHLGAISGLLMSMIVLGSSLGPFAFSLVKAARGSYEFAHWVAFVLASLLCVAALFANNPQRSLKRADTNG